MKVEAILKRNDNGVLYTNKKLKEEAKRIDGFGIEEINQYCSENGHSGIVWGSGDVSLIDKEKEYQED